MQYLALDFMVVILEPWDFLKNCCASLQQTMREASYVPCQLAY